MTHRSTTGSEDERLLSLLSTIADAADLEPTELPPLYDSVDPEALARLIESASEPFTVRFQFAGYEVCIDHAGDVDLVPEDERVPQP